MSRRSPAHAAPMGWKQFIGIVVAGAESKRRPPGQVNRRSCSGDAARTDSVSPVLPKRDSVNWVAPVFTVSFMYSPDGLSVAVSPAEGTSMVRERSAAAGNAPSVVPLARYTAPVSLPFTISLPFTQASEWLPVGSMKATGARAGFERSKMRISGSPRALRIMIASNCVAGSKDSAAKVPPRSRRAPVPAWPGVRSTSCRRCEWIDQ